MAKKSNPKPPQPEVVRYQDSGVNIDEADRAVGYIRGLAKKTFSKSVLTGIGSFGGGFHLKGWKDPVLDPPDRRGRRAARLSDAPSA